MNILSLIIMGVLFGLITKFYTTEKTRGGIVAFLLVGVAGALVGQIIGWPLGFNRIVEFDARTFVIAIASTIIGLVLYRKFFKVRSVPGA